jgi:hypothetical protein
VSWRAPRSSPFQFNDIRRGALCRYIEEQLNLPAILVDGGNRACPQAVVVGQEHQYVSGILAYGLDAAQQVRTLLRCTRSGEPNDLVAENATVLGRFARFNHLVERVVLHAGDEEHPGLGPFREQSVVVVASVIDHDGPGGEAHLVGRLDIMHLALRDDAEAGQVAVVVEHQMQLHRALGAAKLRPVVHRQAQVDHGRVDTDQLILEAELALAAHLGSNLLEQSVEHLLRKLPRAVRIGVGQRGAHRHLDPQVGKLALAAPQTALDLSERMRPSELAEQHPDELTPARQALAAILGTGRFYQAFELNARNELEYLAEHAA